MSPPLPAKSGPGTPLGVVREVKGGAKKKEKIPGENRKRTGGGKNGKWKLKRSIGVGG